MADEISEIVLVAFEEYRTVLHLRIDHGISQDLPVDGIHVMEIGACFEPHRSVLDICVEVLYHSDVVCSLI